MVRSWVEKVVVVDEFMSGDDSVESTGCERSLLHPLRCMKVTSGRGKDVETVWRVVR